jgi:hypothetical protein
LEVVDDDEQRSLQGHALQQLGEGFGDAELGRPVVDQAGDLRAELIGRRQPAAQRIGQGPERAGALELVGIGEERPEPRGMRDYLGEEPGLADPRIASTSTTSPPPARPRASRSRTASSSVDRPSRRPRPWCARRKAHHCVAIGREAHRHIGGCSTGSPVRDHSVA